MFLETSRSLEKYHFFAMPKKKQHCHHNDKVFANWDIMLRNGTNYISNSIVVIVTLAPFTTFLPQSPTL
jgi:hypothetical protein